MVAIQRLIRQSSKVTLLKLSILGYFIIFFPRCSAGGQPNHQLPGVSGAACWGRQAGGPLRGVVRQGLPLGQRRQRAAEASRHRGRRGGPGPQRPAATRPPLRQLRRANWTLRPGHRHHHERDGKHFYFNGRRWWVQKQEVFTTFSVGGQRSIHHFSPADV